MSRLAGEQFNVVDGRSQRHFGKLGVIAWADLNVIAGHDGLADFQSLWQEDVRLLAVGVLHKGNQGGTVGVVFDLGYLARNVVHVPRKVNNTIEMTDTPTLVTNHDLARVVSPGLLAQAKGQGLLRSVPGDLGVNERLPGTDSRRRWFICSHNTHGTPS